MPHTCRTSHTAKVMMSADATIGWHRRAATPSAGWPPARPRIRPATHAGRDLTLTNYLLLALALFQFPYAFYLGVRP